MATDRPSASSPTTASPGIRADKELIRAAAQQLRQAATQGAYRGLHRPEYAYALASVLDLAEVRWIEQDDFLRAELRRCCQVLLDAGAGNDASNNTAPPVRG